MRKRPFQFIVLLLFLSALAVLVSCSRAADVPIRTNEVPAAGQENRKSTILPAHRFGDTAAIGSRESSLAAFLSREMTGPYGVYTNLPDTAENGEAASGHEVLSESASLLLRYDALSGRKQAFEQDWELTQRTFDRNTGFSYRYSPKLNKTYEVNAAVDDLRLIRSLFEAGEVFKDGQYTRLAKSYGERFLKYNAKDNKLVDFYDEHNQTGSRSITLCYVDLKTLGLISGTGALTGRMSDIVAGGYLSDQFPFYQTRYSYDTQAYSGERINTVESLLTILSLSEVNREREESIRYLKSHVKDGTLYGQYTLSGAPLNDVQSTAIYAIAAMIGSTIGDQELYNDSIRKMNAFQIQAPNGVLDGGFADPASGQAYSFDNLMALLAYRY